LELLLNGWLYSGASMSTRAHADLFPTAQHVMLSPSATPTHLAGKVRASRRRNRQRNAGEECKAEHSMTMQGFAEGDIGQMPDGEGVARTGETR
jgi:hypothetical protein